MRYGWPGIYPRSKGQTIMSNDLYKDITDRNVSSFGTLKIGTHMEEEHHLDSNFLVQVRVFEVWRYSTRYEFVLELIWTFCFGRARISVWC